MKPDERQDIEAVISIVKASTPLTKAWSRGYLSAFSLYGAKTEAGRLISRNLSRSLGFTHALPWEWDG